MPVWKSDAGSILTETAFQYQISDYEGWLSIKSMVRGRAHYSTPDRGRFIVEPGGYLILNNGQRYTLEIDAPPDEIVESFVPFFKPALAATVLSSLTIATDRLLDEPSKQADQPITFLETVYPGEGDPLLSALAHFRSATSSDAFCADEMEERLHNLLAQLLMTHRSLGRQIESLPPLRAGTRVELMRRLCRARDFIDAALPEPHSLTEIATVADLSPHHFLRCFAAAFGMTPMHYRANRRLRRAAVLLSNTKRSVTEICGDVGYCSLGTFSAEFHRRYGRSPAAWRSDDLPKPRK